MNIFFDTEFTGLSSDPHLISMGFVAENGATLYIELTDGWLESECSTWVKQHVLPMLGHGEQITRREAALRITNWLSAFESKPVLLGDSDYDTILVAELLHKSGAAPDTFVIQQLVFSTKTQATAFERAKKRLFTTQPKAAHHALTDAQVFRDAWHEVFGRASLQKKLMLNLLASDTVCRGRVT
jgi:hypothetical protein